MTTAAPSMIGGSPSAERWPDAAAFRRYVPPMTTTVKAVLNAIEARRPGLKPAKQHLLLFFAQGHHLAWCGEPLFVGTLHATDRGVALEETNPAEAELIVSEALLGTITNVIVRYSGLTPADLRTLVQASTPWQTAREARDGTRIEQASLTDWFRRPDETDDPDDERPNQAERAEAEAYLASQGQP